MNTIRDLLFWQYARIVSISAGEGKTNYGLISNIFKRFYSREVRWSSSIGDFVKKHEKRNACVYCASSRNLTVEHILPRIRGGPDIPENTASVCDDCNSRKGSKRFYEWYGLENTSELPRTAEAKYLKLLYSLHEARGTLDATPADLCSACDLGAKCLAKGELSVYCLEGQFKKP